MYALGGVPGHPNYGHAYLGGGDGNSYYGVCLDDLFDTYQSNLFEQFRELGVDLTANHDLAGALAYHTSNKPLFGFAKRYRDQDPTYQTELNIALVHHTGRGNAKGVQLCLWAGADPHSDAPSLRYAGTHEEDDSEDDEDKFIGWSAVYEACSHGHVDLLKRLGPDPALDDFDDLYGATDSSAVIEFLARSAPPQDIGVIIQRQLQSASFNFGGYWSTYPLRSLFDVGARWHSASKEQIAYLRQTLVKLPNRDFVDVVKLFAEKDNCAKEILVELGRTPKFRARMKEVGFIPPADEKSRRNTVPRPTRSREVLTKFGIELPKPAVPLPRIVHIGNRTPGGGEIRMDRARLFKLVWSKPVSKLADEWAISDRGLGKACKRLKIPVPPRGYWARLEAGQRPRKPKLPSLSPGEAEEIVILVLQ